MPTSRRLMSKQCVVLNTGQHFTVASIDEYDAYDRYGNGIVTYEW